MRVDESYFTNTNQQMDSIDSILAADEHILWRGKPNKKSYILASVFKMLPLVIIWLAFDSTFIVVIVTNMVNGNMPLGLLGFIIPFFLLHLMPVWIWLKGIAKSAFELKNIEYAITDRRIIIRSGVVGIDFKSLNYVEMEGVNVKVGLIDKLNKVGDIYINATKNSAVLYDIENPYAISRNLQKIMMDIKADVHYPNAFRPENNPGYSSTYQDNPFDDPFKK